MYITLTLVSALYYILYCMLTQDVTGLVTVYSNAHQKSDIAKRRHDRYHTLSDESRFPVIKVLSHHDRLIS